MIREMKPEDWERVADIYKQGLEKGISTFNTVCPTYDDWDKGHFKNCRYVAVEDGQVVGWIAVSPTSSRPVYSGAVEVSVYIDDDFQGQGEGYDLLKYLIKVAPEKGIWSLYSAIFSINAASIALHRKCGFREIGYREQIAKDKFGNWQNTTLMELRL